AELQHEAALVRLHLVDAGGEPADKGEHSDDRKHLESDAWRACKHRQAGAGQRDDVVERGEGAQRAGGTILEIVGHSVLPVATVGFGIAAACAWRGAMTAA